MRKDTTTLALELKHLRSPAVLWATVLGVGFLKPAPGTWGSIAGLLVWWFWLSDYSSNVQLLVIAVYFGSGWLCSELIRRRFQIEDASHIVADEVAGIWIACSLLPKIWWLALLAFALFRLLDIVKPGPIGWLDREVKGGLGVMLDDLVAGMVVVTVLYFALLGAQLLGWLQL